MAVNHLAVIRRLSVHTSFGVIQGRAMSMYSMGLASLSLSLSGAVILVDPELIDLSKMCSIMGQEALVLFATCSSHRSVVSA